MHPAAWEWVTQWVPDHPVSLIDIGGRNINGSPVGQFDTTAVEVVDLVGAIGVSWVGDFLDYPDDGRTWDVALHLEVAEHTPDWPAHLERACELLTDPDGLLIFTAACLTREPHSAADGGPLEPGEHYANIDPDRLTEVLAGLFQWVHVDVTDDYADVRAVARK